MMNTKIAHQVVSEEGIAIDTRSRMTSEESQVIRTAGYDGLIAVISSPEREYALVEKSGSLHLLHSDNLYVATRLSENKVVLFRDANKNIIGSLQVEFDGDIKLSGNGQDLFAYGQQTVAHDAELTAAVALAV